MDNRAWRFLRPAALGGWTCLCALGCAEVPLISPAPDLSGMHLLSGVEDAAGNVVIQFSNQTARHVRWNLIWRTSDEREPGGALLVTEPGQAGTVTLTAGVEQITATAVPLDDEAIAETTRSWSADSLQAGRHFAAGDIITLTLLSQEGDEATLRVEVMPGG